MHAGRGVGAGSERADAETTGARVEGRRLGKVVEKGGHCSWQLALTELNSIHFFFGGDLAVSVGACEDGFNQGITTFQSTSASCSTFFFSLRAVSLRMWRDSWTFVYPSASN